MKTKNKFWHLMLISIVALFACTLSACDGDEQDPIVPPTDEGEVSVTIDTGGSEGDGSSASPIVVENGETLNLALSQKSSYTDPDGSVITREPKANISLNAKLDTLYVKDIKTLTSVNGNPKVESSSSGTAPLRNQTVQTFTIGGQEIVFDLSYEIYKIVNSANKTIEMPYIKLNPAKYGTANSVEKTDGMTRAQAVVTGIRLTPLNQTRGVTVTDTTAYNVSVSFNLDMESVNAKSENKQNLSFTVNYVGVVETSTEYPDPKTMFSYDLNVLGGTKDKASPFTLTRGETLYLEWAQKIDYTYFSMSDLAMQSLNFEPKAYVKLSAASDTLWAETVADFEKVSSGEPNVSITTEETEKKSTNQFFDIGGQKVSAEWVYEVCRYKMPDGNEVSLPYMELGDLTLASVSAVKKGGAEDVEEVDGKTVGVYEITAKFSQDLMTQQQNEEAKQTVEYIVKYIGVIEVKLVDIKYRKDYVWHQPHDNIPLALQLIVYRDRTYSNGVTFTDEYRSNLMAVDWSVFAASWTQDGGGKIDEEIILPNGEKVFYHKLSINNTDYGGVATCKTRVSDIFAYTPEFIEDLYGVVGKDLSKYYSFRDDVYFDPSAPKAGWYALSLSRCNYVRMIPKDEAFCMREYKIQVHFPDRFCYIKDNIDERMIDFFDKEMTFDYNYQEEQTTTPEGYPARVVTSSYKTEFFDKEFNFAVIDTIYQTTPLQ